MPAIQVKRRADFVEFPREAIFQGIHERIEEQVRLHPGHLALRARHVEYTYAEMNSAANAIAEAILSVSGKELAQAAILQPNSPEVIVSILASLKAHKAYVPLDPAFPGDRLKMMIDDAEPVVLLTDDENLALAEELAGNRVHVINVSQLRRSCDAPNPGVPCNPMDRAYILFTSGSTGRPKGIAFLHRNLLHTSMCLINNLFYSHGDRVTWLHSCSFAASVVDIYCPLLTGGTVYPWDVKTQGFTGFADWLVQEKMTTFQWIPSAFRQFLRTVPDNFVFPDIRIVVMASEPLTVREVELFRRHFPVGSHLINQVGTSESYNYRLFAVDHHLQIQGASVPGGYPVSQDREVLILDDEHHPLPSGSLGEIGIRSDFMSAGYWRDAQLTRDKFIRLAPDSAPVYLTGDLGRLEEDGCLSHLGRKDFQVKIRGYRVELAEVDQVLAAAPGIADGITSVVKNGLGQDQLVAYVVLANRGSFDRQIVERHLESVLPDYMVPRHYVELERLPATPTGKTDRNRLPNPFDRSGPRTAAPALSETALEEQVVRVFEEVMQTEHNLSGMDFIEAGGDSILTAVLLQRIHKRFGVEIAADKFLESPTPSRLAGLIRAALEGGRESLPSAVPGKTVIRPATRRADQNSLTQNLIIISAGRFGRETYTWAADAIAAGARYRIGGFLDNRADALAGYDYGVGILENVDNYQVRDDDVFIGAIGDPHDKIKYYSPIIEKGGRFINLIHPLANVGRNVRLGSGIVLAPFASVTSDITIGDHVAIGAFSNVGHDAVVGNWCQISSHCGINGRAVLGDAVFLGSHACIIPGVTVGDSAFVGAGTVVLRDVPPRVKVVGNPAVVIGTV